MTEAIRLMLLAQVRALPWRFKNIRIFYLNHITYRDSKLKIYYYCTKGPKLGKKPWAKIDESETSTQ